MKHAADDGLVNTLVDVVAKPDMQRPKIQDCGPSLGFCIGKRQHHGRLRTLGGRGSSGLVGLVLLLLVTNTTTVLLLVGLLLVVLGI